MLKFYLDARDVKGDKEAPVKFKIIKDGKASYIASDIRVRKDQWNKKENRIIEHPNAKRLNKYLDERYFEIEELLLHLRHEFAPLTAVEKRYSQPHDKACTKGKTKGFIC